MTVALAVIAKAPLPGRVKTRLTPPCSAREAAALAEAALRDTLAAVEATPAPRRVLVLDGDADGWLPDGFEVIPQRGEGLAERLASAFADIAEPTVLIGMDTPQIAPPVLAAGQRAVERGDAALGPATDGGYWGIGLAAPDARAFAGVPMSSSATGAAQRAALDRLGLTVALLPELRDVDTIDDARAVAAEAPGTAFAAAVRCLGG